MSEGIQKNPVILEFDSSSKALVPCKVCGSVVGRALPGTGPHPIRLECDGCGRFHNWMGFYEAAALRLIELE